MSSREPVCRSCLKKTLHKLEAMMRVLQAETTAGTGTPTAIADSILNITGVGWGRGHMVLPQPPPIFLPTYCVSISLPPTPTSLPNLSSLSPPIHR